MLVAICSSGQPAATCCLTDNGWRKAPTPVSLANTGENGSHDKCYLRDTKACSTKITGEHPVSEAVLKVLAQSELEVSGLPWLKGEKKILKFGALTANCLKPQPRKLWSVRNDRQRSPKARRFHLEHRKQAARSIAPAMALGRPTSLPRLLFEPILDRAVLRSLPPVLNFLEM
jgi:hypothetical protein